MRKALLLFLFLPLFGNGCTIESITLNAEDELIIEWAYDDTSEETASSPSNVVRVVDGDTVVVLIDGEEETVRIIGLNTPETVDPRKPVECFGIEASNRAKELMTNVTISLQEDPSQGQVDKYGRLLRYVTLPDGSDFGEIMISEGLAYEYTYQKPYERQDAYRLAQEKAEQELLGLWNPENCTN